MNVENEPERHAVPLGSLVWMEKSQLQSDVVEKAEALSSVRHC